MITNDIIDLDVITLVVAWSIGTSLAHVLAMGSKLRPVKSSFGHREIVANMFDVSIKIKYG